MPKDVFKPPQFRGDKIGDSARAQTFVKLLDEYFSIVPFIYEEVLPSSWTELLLAWYERGST